MAGDKKEEDAPDRTHRRRLGINKVDVLLNLSQVKLELTQESSIFSDLVIRI